MSRCTVLYNIHFFTLSSRQFLEVGCADGLVFFFQLIGLGLIAVGSLVVVGADALASVLKAFEDIPAVSSVVSGLAWALIGLGIFLVVMGVLGGCGACCSIKVFLIGVSIEENSMKCIC